MSEKVNVKINGATENIIKLGASIYNCSVEKNKLTIDSSTFTIKKDGTLFGDFYYLKDLDGTTLASTGEKPKAREITGLLVQAGTISQCHNLMEKKGYSIKSNPRKGTLTATRGAESITIAIDVNGKSSFDANGFQGRQCTTKLDSMIKSLGNTTILSRTAKTQPNQVVTNIQG